MLQFKQFVGSGQELERSINGWLNEFEPDVTQMVQTPVNGGQMSIGFLFEESFRGQEKRLSYEHGVRNARPAPITPDTPIVVSPEPGMPLEEPAEVT